MEGSDHCALRPYFAAGAGRPKNPRRLPHFKRLIVGAVAAGKEAGLIKQAWQRCQPDRAALRPCFTSEAPLMSLLLLNDHAPQELAPTFDPEMRFPPLLPPGITVVGGLLILLSAFHC